MFIAAYEGYFDKEQANTLMMRNIALFASHRSGEEFNKLWPIKGVEEPVKMVWGTKEDMALLRAQIEKAHNIKLS